MSHYHSETWLGTIGGTLLSTIGVNTGDIVKTIVLGAIGAIVSFLISLLLQKISDKYFK